MAEGWKKYIRINDFTAKILREGIRDPPQNPEWGNDDMIVITQMPEEREFGVKAVKKGLRSDTRALKR